MRCAVMGTVTFLVVAMTVLAEGPDRMGEVSATLGYGFPIGGSHIATSERYAVPQSPGVPVEETDHFRNFGSGLKIGVGGGVRLMERVSFTGSVEYTAGVPQIREEDQNEPIGGLLRITRERTYHYSTLGLKAMVAPRFEILNLMDMYIGAGLGFFAGFSSWDEQRSDNTSARVVEKNRPALGFLGACGTEYPLADQVALVAELGLEAFSVRTTSYTVEESTIPGVRIGETNYDDNVTDRAWQPRTPGTNLTLRVGVKYLIF